MKILFGLLSFLLIISLHGQGNLIVNGGFDNDASGWVSNGGGYYESSKGNPGGDFLLRLRSTISQTINLTVGNNYIISGNYNLEAGSLQKIPSLEVTINQSVIWNTAAQDYGWDQFSVSYTATSTIETLSLITENGYSYRIDNISVMETPEPESFTVIVAGFGIVGIIFLFRNRHT